MKRILATLFVALLLPTAALAAVPGRQFAKTYMHDYNMAAQFNNRLLGVSCENSRVFKVANGTRQRLYPCAIKAKLISGRNKGRVFCAVGYVRPQDYALFDNRFVACPNQDTGPVA